MGRRLFAPGRASRRQGREPGLPELHRQNPGQTGAGEMDHATLRAGAVAVGKIYASAQASQAPHLRAKAGARLRGGALVGTFEDPVAWQSVLALPSDDIP